jgi:hypothetical protein
MFIRAFITMVAADAVDRHMREQQRLAWVAEEQARAEAAAARDRPPLARPVYDPARPERPA